MGLTKIRAHTLTLGASNNYSGPTLVTGGTLDLASGGALQGSTFVSSTAGSVLFDPSVSSGAFTFGGLSGVGALNLQNSGGTAITLSVGGNSANTTYSGTLGGAGSLVKVGAGTLTLNGLSSYSGSTTVSGGVLEVAGTANLPGYTTGSRIAIDGGGTLALSVGGTSGWQASNVSTFLLANSNNFTSLSSLGFDTTGGTFSFGAISGSMGLTKLGVNTLTLTSASTFLGPTLISSGSLQLGDGSGNNGSLAGTAGITNNGALVFNNLSTAQTYAGSIGGYGSLVKLGNNTQVLTGSNTYSGNTSISTGTLQLGDGNGHNGSLSAASGISDNSWLVYNLSGSQTSGNTIKRFGQLDKDRQWQLVPGGQ